MTIMTAEAITELATLRQTRKALDEMIARREDELLAWAMADGAASPAAPKASAAPERPPRPVTLRAAAHHRDGSPRAAPAANPDGGARWPLHGKATTGTAILLALREAVTATVPELCEATRMESSALSQAVYKLVNAGMVEQMGDGLNYALTAAQEAAMNGTGAPAYLTRNLKDGEEV